MLDEEQVRKDLPGSLERDRQMWQVLLLIDIRNLLQEVVKNGRKN